MDQTLFPLREKSLHSWLRQTTAHVGLFQCASPPYHAYTFSHRPDGYRVTLLVSVCAWVYRESGGGQSATPVIVALGIAPGIIRYLGGFFTWHALYPLSGTVMH